MGKIWLLVWVARGVGFVARRDKDGKETRMAKTNDGLTEAPFFKKKRIFLRAGLKCQRRKLESAIHEYSHAADWTKDEEWITQFAHDMSNFLYALGVRFVEEPDWEVEDDPETLEG